MLRIAFASNDRLHVNQHFGSATGFVIFDVTPQGSALVGVGEFPEEAMDGNESKLIAKVDYLAGCAAVFVMAIGASAIKQLMAKGIQPIRIGEVDNIEALLADVGQAMQDGGVAWVDRAMKAQAAKADAGKDKFAEMEEEGWTG